MVLAQCGSIQQLAHASRAGCGRMWVPPEAPVPDLAEPAGRKIRSPTAGTASTNGRRHHTKQAKAKKMAEETKVRRKERSREMRLCLVADGSID
jgi:hypothetical protein